MTVKERVLEQIEAREDGSAFTAKDFAAAASRGTSEVLSKNPIHRARFELRKAILTRHDQLSRRYSGDGGETFHRADGTKVELPLTVNPAPSHHADIHSDCTERSSKLWLSLLRHAGY